MNRILTLFLCILAGQMIAQTQADSLILPTHKVWLRDGNRFLGTIIHESDDSTHISTKEYGIIAVETDAIRRIKSIEAKYINPDGTLKSYSFQQVDFAGQTGFGPKKGDVTYRNFYILGNDLEVGLTDYLSVQGGFTWTVLFPDIGGPAWITPKVHFPIVKDVVHTSLSYFHFEFFNGYSEGRAWAKFIHSATSVRVRNSQYTIGVGVGKRNDYTAAIQALTLSGQLQLGRNLHLLSENYFVRASWGNYGAGSMGVRFGRRAKFDLGMGYVIDEYQYFYPVPMLQFRIGL